MNMLALWWRVTAKAKVIMPGASFKENKERGQGLFILEDLAQRLPRIMPDAHVNDYSQRGTHLLLERALLLDLLEGVPLDSDFFLSARYLRRYSRWYLRSRSCSGSLDAFFNLFRRRIIWTVAHRYKGTHSLTHRSGLNHSALLLGRRE